MFAGRLKFESIIYDEIGLCPNFTSNHLVNIAQRRNMQILNCESASRQAFSTRKRPGQFKTSRRFVDSSNIHSAPHSGQSFIVIFHLDSLHYLRGVSVLTSVLIRVHYSQQQDLFLFHPPSRTIEGYFTDFISYKS